MELYDIIGREGELVWWQMAIRALIVFLMMVLLVRVGGNRAFAEWSAYDIVISIILGSILSRAITGNAPFVPTIIAGTVLVLAHLFVSIISYRFHVVGLIFKGRKQCIVKNGKLQRKKMALNQVTERDLQQAMRINGITDLSQVANAYVERNGKISFLLRDDQG